MDPKPGHDIRRDASRDAIALQDVSKRFDGTVALAPTTLRVAAGQRLVLIGPSGCGKSTLLRILVGLVTPDTGRVEIAGTPLDPGTLREIRLRIGYVIQEGGLFPHLTAAENVTLMARELGWERARIRERLAELAQLTRLPVEWLSRYPLQLSGGQRQRVGLMRALMLDPSVLLMDEPLGALDPIIRSELQRELREIFQRLAKTVLFVTHDMAEAAYVGDEIAVMREGRIVQRGTLDELRARPAEAFVANFLEAQRVLSPREAARETAPTPEST